jgi:hypothetical protein
MMKDKVDYAPYYLEAMTKLKEAHDLLLKHQFTPAIGKLDDVIVVVRLMRSAVKSHAE